MRKVLVTPQVHTPQIEGQPKRSHHSAIVTKATKEAETPERRLRTHNSLISVQSIKRLMGKEAHVPNEVSPQPAPKTLNTMQSLRRFFGLEQHQEHGHGSPGKHTHKSFTNLQSIKEPEHAEVHEAGAGSPQRALKSSLSTAQSIRRFLGLEHQVHGNSSLPRGHGNSSLPRGHGNGSLPRGTHKSFTKLQSIREPEHHTEVHVVAMGSRVPTLHRTLTTAQTFKRYFGVDDNSSLH